MPIYEYECEKGHIFEALILNPKDENLVCPKCGGPVRRIISVPNLKENAGIYVFDRRTGRDILHDK